LSKAKGEHYNMFSVFQIETRENKTHSNFLAELINPKGSHQMGAVFLLLFQEVLGHSEEAIKSSKSAAYKPFVWNKAVKVTKEKSIGKRNDDEQTGGRIDIFLRDNSTPENYICIENKIHADDQPLQIKRYCNYNTKRNTIYYLTLTGEEPSPDSRKDLNSDEHFILISYKDHIQKWLELCLKEVVNFTNLRETINQYILLIKKLTYTLNKEQQAELTKLMLDNFEGSKYISENYDRVLNQLRDNFRKKLMDELKVELKKEGYNFEYLVEIGGPIQKNFAQIWIRMPQQPEFDFCFGIESFSGKGNLNGNLFVGIYNQNNSPLIASLPDDNMISNLWRQVQPIKSKENNNINLSNAYWVKVLSYPKSVDYKSLLEKCKTDILEFIKKYDQKLFRRR
jgi:hypothetical protein